MCNELGLFEGYDNLGYHIQCFVLISVTQNNISITRLLLASPITTHNDHLKSWVNQAGVFQYCSGNGRDFVSGDPQQELVVIFDTKLLRTTERVPAELDQII